ncbi:MULTISPECIES: RNHCP domain-containing protein [unclassified Clostridioides]|uniref:RNHCP domain-containing protein n=1 Tax=unclassified Clostridioides TaxID=2635829 RepID=UPI001D11CDD1|nr:RNHCP domain-containing protein [Clostridioides sp. ZZV14-6105]MCC0727743.1 RNHCP domain-containing protein [Clostridioides sp. ZZV14-6045]MCC0732402.1 RNHCP domain-containing protein [Clostridioides sp. ZZV14-6048]MCC0736448.1 RNHCP domain-containing protein [Clostridioides sp. ZZV14-6009]
MNYTNRKRAYYQDNTCLDNFICKKCGCLVVPEGSGTQHRNHCPHCLHSLHVDIIPGDRVADCDGDMEPIGVWVRKNGEWAIIHRCTRCGHLSSNRVAADDNPMKLMSIALKPLAQPPFPLEKITEIMEKEEEK